MSKYAQMINPNATVSQREAIPGRESEMVTNNAGGVVFKIDNDSLVDRFLILGSEKPSYYVSAKQMTKQAAGAVLDAIKYNGVKCVDRIVEISQSGRAPKNSPAVFALALAAVNGDDAVSKYAYANLHKVARTGTDLFEFVSTVDTLGKWNANAKRGISAWYTQKDIGNLAYQLMKYQSRNGWSHRDVIRLAHPRPASDVQNNVFKYVTGGSEKIESGMEMPQLIIDYELIKRDPSKANVMKVISNNRNITWEMVPTSLHRDKDVMSLLVQNMGMTALIRKLGQLSNIGVIDTFSEDRKLIMSKLSDAEAIKKARVHPITILNAVKQYSRGSGDKGSLTWKVDRGIVDSLTAAFYDSFQYIESTNQNYLLGIDCSGSMFSASVVGAQNLTAAEVAAVMALAVVKRESNYWIGGFNTRMGELAISPNQSIEEVLKVIQRFSWGGTDCSLPMRHAIDNKIGGVDKFVIYTDNETWAGREQPVQSLNRYRKTYNTDSKLIVCGTSVNDFTIADPKDKGMLDIVGFDSAAPQLVQMF